MKSDIQTKFGKDYDIFMDYVDGYTYKLLDQKYGITNSTYRIRKIRNYIQKYYPELGVGRKKRIRKAKK